MRICLIACCSQKLDRAAAARDLYCSDLFVKSLGYATGFGFERVGIVSAKHGLLMLDEQVKPYDVFLADFGVRDRQKWGARVVGQMVSARWLDEGSELTLLAGRLYCDAIESALGVGGFGAGKVEVHRPLKGLGIGHQKAWLKQRLVGYST